MKNICCVLIILMLSFQLHAQNDSLRNLDINLENYEYPFPVKFLKLDLQGEKLRMAYMDVVPEKANGKTIVLMHGKNFNGAYWEQTARALTKSGFRVIIPDQIGFGKSSKPAHFQYTIHQLAANTRQILNTLNIPAATILGHSMSGMIAMRFALMYPEITEKLVLVNPLGLEDYKLKVPYQSVDQWYETELKSSFESIKKYQLNSYYDGKWKDAYTPWVNLLAGWTLNKDYPKIAWNSALTYDMIMTQPVIYEIQYITSPALLIIGQRDRSAVGKNLATPENQKVLGNYPELGKKAHQLIRNSQLVELDGVGHLPPIEDFDRFIKPLLTFLNGK